MYFATWIKITRETDHRTKFPLIIYLFIVILHNWVILLVIVQPLIITVHENETVLDDTPDKFSMEAVCNIS
jgi:hypothetical protein